MLWVRRLFQRGRLERELDQELAYHVERRVAELVAQGMDAREAGRRVRLEFGGVDAIKEDCRDARGTRWLVDFLRDCQYGLRMLRRSPVFTIVAILSLALGVGANTAIFSLMDRVMFRMMPVREPERLVEIGPCCLSYPLLNQLRQGLTSFEGLLAHNSPGVLDIAVDGEMETANFDLVSGSYYSLLGVNAAIGRTFTEDVDRVPGANPVAVISHRYWVRRFASDPATIGKTFRRLNTVFTIIGVTPREFFGTVVGREPDITVPITMQVQVEGGRSWLNKPDHWWLGVMGRLKPGRRIDQARAELNTLNSVLSATTTAASTQPKHPAIAWKLQPGGNGFDNLRREFSEPLALLMGTVALVLLLACANLANLLLAKSAARQREIAVRLAVGAGRGRVARQLSAEGLLLALAGGAIGVLLAYALAEGVVTMMSNGGPRMLIDVAPDGHVLIFAVAVSLAACLLFSLAPAFQATRQSFQPALAEIRAGRWRTGKGLVVAQMAISVLLLIGAGLFGRTLFNMYRLDAGFDRRGVVLFSTNVTGLGYAQDRVQDVQARVLAELNTLPGVQSASVHAFPPISDGSWTERLAVEGHAAAASEGEVSSHLNSVSPGFFKTFGTPVVLGRAFNRWDTAASPPVAIVNEAFSRYYFQDQSPLGKWVAFRGPEVNRHYEIVGVVQDVKYESLRGDFPRTAYFTVAQVPDPIDPHTFAARTGKSIAAVAPAIEAVLARVDKALRAQDVHSLEDHVARSLLQERMLATLAGFFGALALLLGAVGIYGVMAFQVARRRREIGIRMALGAAPGSVTGMVLGQTARLTIAGCAIGATGGLVLTRVAKGILYGIQPHDPVTFGAAIAGLVLVGLGAAYLPGRNAARTNPVETLRAD